MRSFPQLPWSLPNFCVPGVDASVRLFGKPAGNRFLIQAAVALLCVFLREAQGRYHFREGDAGQVATPKISTSMEGAGFLKQCQVVHLARLGQLRMSLIVVVGCRLLRMCSTVSVAPALQIQATLSTCPDDLHRLLLRCNLENALVRVTFLFCPSCFAIPSVPHISSPQTKKADVLLCPAKPLHPISFPFPPKNPIIHLP